MDADRWTQLSEYLETALSMPAEARAEFVERIRDEALRRELVSLLAANESAAGFLERPVALACDPPSTDEVLESGALVGHWRVLRFIGRGGMGEVYDAERAAGDFAQRAALKLTRRELASQSERFNAERQILARLDHPSIARLLDGGVAADGRPYFAMEYIDGQWITDYCDAAKAGLAQRLALFAQVCDAVAHAHRHLVVHRDIKPANVLVDAEGRARLLDFGIAKPLDVGIGASSAAPGMTTALLTPDYAAPEQLAGEPVTTATDIYALGVLLFELVTGRRPWAIEGQPIARALHSILERPAPLAHQAASETEERPIGPRALQGDFDAIIAKCLRREPQHRYATVNALKLDVDRALRGDPITAREDVKLYVFGRFLRRYRWAVASVAAIFLVLGAGIAATAWQASRAEREAVRAAATRDFLVGVFKASDPRVAQDKPRGQVTARELLDASVRDMEGKFAGDAETQIELLGIVTEIYRELGEEQRYQELHARHLTTARERYGERHPVVLSAVLSEAIHARDRYDMAEALRLLDELDSLIRSAGLDRTVLRARWWLTRGQAMFGDSARMEEQLAALRTAAALFETLAPRDPALVTTLADIGTVYSNHLDFASARAHYDQAIAAAEIVENRNDAELATIYGNLGLISFNLGDFEAADVAYARSEEIVRRTYGESRNIHWIPAANRARAAHLGGNRERAGALFSALLASIPADSKHHDAVEAREWYAGCLAAEGRATEALPFLEEAERFYQSTPLYDYELPRVRLTLGDAYDRAGRTEQARATLKAALDQRLATSPPDQQPLLAVRERWGRFLLTQGDLAGAETEFQEVIRQAHGRKLAHIALAHGGMARVALARADSATALGASGTALALFEDVTGFRDVRMGPYLWLVHSEALRRSGDSDGARAWATRALDARLTQDHPAAASIVEAQAALAAAGAETDQAVPRSADSSR